VKRTPEFLHARSRHIRRLGRSGLGTYFVGGQENVNFYELSTGTLNITTLGWSPKYVTVARVPSF
jgi:hypothetical protein